MKFTSLEIPDLIIIEPDVFEDERGFFFEAYNQNKFNLAIDKNIKFVQDNHSKSTKGVLRGLHFQKPPFQQAKLLRVIKGEIFDVCVDLRKNSKTFGKWIGLNINEHNKKQLFIPIGFAHGFAVLSSTAEVIYKVSNFYSREHEGRLRFDDPFVNIKWPISIIGISTKDKKGDFFQEVYKFDN